MSVRPEFGRFYRAKRKERGMTLRSYCRENGFEPAYISRLERGIVPPPRSRSARELHARALGLKEESEEWYAFFDLADLCGGRMPERLMEDEEVLRLVPLFFRTARKSGLGAQDLRRLIERLKEETH